MKDHEILSGVDIQQNPGHLHPAVKLSSRYTREANLGVQKIFWM